MNLIDEEQIEKENFENKKKEKWLLIGIIITAVILVALISTLAYLVILRDGGKLKLRIDGVQVSAFNEDLIIVQDNDVYVEIKTLAQMLGYETYNGEYKKYTEDKTCCYIKNENEIAGFNAKSKEIYKISAGETYYQYYKIDKEIKKINDKIYVPMQGIDIGVNASTTFENNLLQINTVQYISSKYLQQFPTAKFDTLDDMKTVLYGYMISKGVDESTDKNDKDVPLGLMNLKGQEVVGNKYSNITFIPEIKEFLVSTEEGTVGIIDLEGNIKIAPKYSSIQIVDAEEGLYLVKNDEKYGMIDKKGDIVIYIEYDEIGIPNIESYSTQNIKNSYILFDNCIPVKKDDKWGLLSKTGDAILDIEYDGIGSSEENGTKSVDEVVIIEDVEGIVVKKQDYYGIVGAKGDILVPTALTAVYSVTNNGKISYQMDYQGQAIDVLEYLNQSENQAEGEKEENYQEENISESENEGQYEEGNESESIEE